jgi:hypothetical protein
MWNPGNSVVVYGRIKTFITTGFGSVQYGRSKVEDSQNWCCNLQLLRPYRRVFDLLFEHKLIATAFTFH